MVSDNAQTAGTFVAADSLARSYGTVLVLTSLPKRELNISTMLQSYIRIAWRNLYRYPGYSFITVVGLGIGIAGCLFVLLYLQDELSFDRFNEQSDRTYRVVEVRPTPDQGDQRFAYTAGILAPTLVAEVPEVDKSIRLIGSYGVGRRTVSHGDRRFYEGEYLFAEPGI
ncbi:MAG: ABC transporter permease, partial [Rhodothermales bacterium]